MSKVGEELIAGLKEFEEKIETGEPVMVTEITRVKTPQGPTYLRRKFAMFSKQKIDLSKAEIDLLLLSARGFGARLTYRDLGKLAWLSEDLEFLLQKGKFPHQRFPDGKVFHLSTDDVELLLRTASIVKLKDRELQVLEMLLGA